jgi:exonuclease SbcD
MRIIHFADLHIGYEMYGRPLTDRPWTSRLQDTLDAFDHLVEFALSEGVDAVIFAGDAFKSREPTQTQQREFASRIRRLSDAGVPTFLLVGNHDLPNAEGRAHALEIYRTLSVPNVFIGDEFVFAGGQFKPTVLETRAGPVQVACLPWPRESRLMANDPDVANMSIEQVRAEVEKKLTAVIAAQAAHLDADIPAILTCHVSINDFLVRNNKGSEDWMTVGEAATLLKSELHEASFDYIALGHHHNNMDLQMHTPCWYSGSMQPVDFGEEGQKKGFMVFDIDPKARLGARLSGNGLPKMEPVPQRRFVTVEVHARTDDPTAEVCAAIARQDVRDAIVRVHAHVTADQNRDFRIPEVRRALESAHFVQGVRAILPQDQRAILPAGLKVDSASPLESLETFFKLKQVEEERRGRLLAAAGDLMRDVDEPRA